ncbi:MAG: AAA family ATPase, partial [Anaerolineae bacterium]|nr:AAA family ATPase [Anaerolineae bacterium]
MSEPILMTKLYIPPVRPGLIRRPRLLERLDEALHYRLTLISAPAGFGKTTLLSDWVHQVRAPVAWISLDEGDNNAARFLAYLVAALQGVSEGVGRDVQEALQAFLTSPTLHAPEPGGGMGVWWEQALVRLLNQLVTVADPFVLVLDDYHLISAQAVHDVMRFLLAHLPSQMHLVISSRVDPPLSLSRWRGRGQLNELRTADLRFTAQEVAAFFGGMAGLALTLDEIRAIEARTEGWIVGLQMAALSMRDQDTHGIAGFIDEFAGSHRYVLDYLTDEVLQRQPKDVQAFLLCASVLDRFTAPLCDALLGEPIAGQEEEARGESGLADSQQMLEYLDRSNLFVVALDDRREWYRYHHLFRELLQQRLRRAQPELLPSLQQRASVWHEANGAIGDAVRYAVAAGDVERVAYLVEHNIAAVLDRGQLTTLAHWLDDLPEVDVYARPWLCVAYAWVLTYAGQLDEAEALLQRAEASAAHAQGTSLDESLGGQEAIEGHAAAIRAYAAWVAGEHGIAVRRAQAALARLRDQDHTARGLASVSLGAALLELGDLARAADALREAIRLAGSESHIGLLAIPTLADVLIRQGYLAEAAALCRTVLGYDERYVVREGPWLPAAAITFGMMSTILYRWNEVEAAAEMARQGVRLAEQWGHADSITFCSIHLGHSLAALGDVKGANETFARARQVADTVSEWFGEIVDVYAAQANLLRGDMADAVQWVEQRGLRADTPLSVGSIYDHRLYAHLLLAQGRAAEALEVVAQLRQLLEATGSTGMLIHALALRALGLEMQGERDAALEALAQALSIAEPEGEVRAFVDLGEPMQRLLARARGRDPTSAFVVQLLAAFASAQTRGAVAQTRGAVAQTRGAVAQTRGAVA